MILNVHGSGVVVSGRHIQGVDVGGRGHLGDGQVVSVPVRVVVGARCELGMAWNLAWRIHQAWDAEQGLLAEPD